MRCMTQKIEDINPVGDAIGTLLTALSEDSRQSQEASEPYRRMAASETIGAVVRQLETATTADVGVAYRVLTKKFGLEGSHALYDYLFEIPMRFRLYREAFNRETHVGCVDRAVEAVAGEIETAGDPLAPKADPRFAKAGLAADGHGGVIGDRAAAGALILADLFDDSRRIQRLSCDTRAIVGRIIASGAPVDPQLLAGTVRLIMGTAADIAREQDGLDHS